MSSTFLKLLWQSKAKQKKEYQNEPTILLFGRNHKLEEAM